MALCWICGKELASKTELNIHLTSRDHRRMTVVCVWCNGEKTFTRPSDLYFHCKQKHLVETNSLHKSFFSTMNCFYFSVYPQDYSKITKIESWSTPNAIEARRLVMKWLEQQPGAAVKRDNWRHGWRNATKAVTSNDQEVFIATKLDMKKSDETNTQEEINKTQSTCTTENSKARKEKEKLAKLNADVDAKVKISNKGEIETTVETNTQEEINKTQSACTTENSKARKEKKKLAKLNEKVDAKVKISNNAELETNVETNTQEQTGKTKSTCTTENSKARIEKEKVVKPNEKGDANLMISYCNKAEIETTAVIIDKNKQEILETNISVKCNNGHNAGTCNTDPTVSQNKYEHSMPMYTTELKYDPEIQEKEITENKTNKVINEDSGSNTPLFDEINESEEKDLTGELSLVCQILGENKKRKRDVSEDSNCCKENKRDRKIEVVNSEGNFRRVIVKSTKDTTNNKEETEKKNTTITMDINNNDCTSTLNSFTERAKDLLTTGVMPLCPPGRREWDVPGIYKITINGHNFSWPPINWKTMTPDRKLLAWEYLALSLEEATEKEVCSELSRIFILDKYNFLALPGTAKPRKEETEIAISRARFYTYQMLREVATGKSPTKAEQHHIISLEQHRNYTDDFLLKLRSIQAPLRLINS